MNLKPYREYMATGIEWLPEIPVGWIPERLKWSTYIKARVGWKGLTSSEFEDSSFAYLVTGTDFKSRYIDWSSCYQVSQARYEDDPYIQLLEGDLLITKDGTIGKLAIVRNLDKAACLNSGIFVLRPGPSYSSEFLFWVLSSSVFGQFVDLTTYGSTIMHLYQNVLVDFALPVTSLEEQSQIVNYLDRETAEIDAFIADQEELIALLNERRAATITQAVTKGIDPTVPMKDSRVEWLGDVPEPWSVEKLSRLAKIGNGSTPATENPDYWLDGNVPWLNSSCVNLAEVVEPSKFVTETALRVCHLPMVPAGSLLVGLTGQGKTRGMATRLRISSTINQHLAYVTPLRRLNSSFALWFLVSAYEHLRFISDGNGGTKGGLTCDQLGRVQLPMPSINDQIAIADYLDRETAEIDATIADAREAIALSKERRAALISAAVTGKVDVRGAMTEAQQMLEGEPVGAA